MLVLTWSFFMTSSTYITIFTPITKTLTALLWEKGQNPSFNLHAIRTAVSVWSFIIIALFNNAAQTCNVSWRGESGGAGGSGTPSELSLPCDVIRGVQTVSRLMIIVLVQVNKNDHVAAFMQLRLTHTKPGWAQASGESCDLQFLILRPRVYDRHRHGYAITARHAGRGPVREHFSKILNTTCKCSPSFILYLFILALLAFHWAYARSLMNLMG